MHVVQDRQVEGVRLGEARERKRRVVAWVGAVAIAVSAVVSAAGAARASSGVRPDALAAVQVIDVAQRAKAVPGGDPRMEALAVVGDSAVLVGSVVGQSAWHVHQGSEEFLVVLGGEVTIYMQDASGDAHSSMLGEGQGICLPAGVSHRLAGEDAEVLIFQESSAVSQW